MVTTSAVKQREQDKQQYNAYLALCPSQQLLGRLSDKWVVLVLSALGSGPDCDASPRPMRYSEIGRVLAGVSPKMLSQTLKALERDGLLSRTATPTVPVTVTYELTDLGLSLHQAVRQTKRWAETHMSTIAENRAHHDLIQQGPRS